MRLRIPVVGVLLVGLALLAPPTGWASDRATHTAAGPALRPASGAPSDAPQGGSVAVFGDNCINSLVGGTLVSDADIATPGFLDNFSALVVTRDGDAFGDGLSSAAAANVIAYATGGNVALFPGDWADMVTTPSCASGDPEDTTVEQALLNGAAFASLSGHGYVGEFNGTAMAVTTNANGFNPLNLIAGDAGTLDVFDDAVDTVTVLDPAHPVAAGLPGVFSPIETSTFRTPVTGVPPENVVATWADGAPAIIATSCEVGICDCVAGVELLRREVEAGGSLAFKVSLAHWRSKVVRTPFSISIVNREGRTLLDTQSPEYLLHRGDRINFTKHLQIPPGASPGSYVLKVSIGQMQQGRAVAKAEFTIK